MTKDWEVNRVDELSNRARTEVGRFSQILRGLSSYCGRRDDLPLTRESLSARASGDTGGVIVRGGQKGSPLQILPRLSKRRAYLHLN